MHMKTNPVNDSDEIPGTWYPDNGEDICKLIPDFSRWN